MERARPTNMPWSVVSAVVVLTAGAVAATFSAIEGTDFMYDLEQTHPALSTVPPDLEPSFPALSHRVVVAIVDGLRYDVSRDLSYFNSLREVGVDGDASSQYPTYSKPNYVNILTGVPPTASGVRTNFFPGTVTLDSLMDRVRAVGMHAGYASDYDAMPRLFLRPRAQPVDDVADTEDMDELRREDELTPEIRQQALMADLVGAFDDARYAPWSGGFRDAAMHELANQNDALVVFLVGVVDEAGHAYGGNSIPYRAAAASVDLTLGEVLRGVDLSRDTVILTADHGHTDRGGHGGLEPLAVHVPLVMAGAGVVAGAQLVDAKLQDVAPTVARLLGVPPPGHALGRTLVEALAFDDATRTAIAGADAERAARNQAVVDDGIAQARAYRLEKRARRLMVLAGGFLAIVVAAWWLRRLGGLRLDWRSLAIGVPAFFAVYYIMLAVIGQRFSPSMVPARGYIHRELLKYGAVATAAQISAGWWALRKKVSLPDRLAAANGIALVGLVIAMVPVALVWTLFPAPYVEVPGPRNLVLIPAVEISVACYAVGVALTLAIEVIVFFSRAVDPRVRMLRLERAMEKARAEADRTKPPTLPPF